MLQTCSQNDVAAQVWSQSLQNAVMRPSLVAGLNPAYWKEIKFEYSDPVKCEIQFSPEDILDGRPIPAEDRDAAVAYLENEWWDCYNNWDRDVRQPGVCDDRVASLTERSEVYAEYMKELEEKADALGYQDAFKNGKATWQVKDEL